MRVDAGTAYQYASQRAQAPAADRGAAASSPSTQAAAASGSAKPGPAGVTRADFTSMTRLEMRDWVNAQIRGGAMSLDEGRPFMAMTMRVPVGGGPGGELPAASDGERFDFTRKVRDGIEAARSRNDATTLEMLRSAMSVMERQQGQVMRVDMRA